MTVDAAPARDPQPRSRYDFTRVQLGELLADQPRYRVDQVWQGLYGPNGDPESWTNVPKALRSRLSDVLAPALTPLTESVSDEGDTSKWLWSLHDGRQIETVLMHYPDRSTVCISSQAGCAMACGFCATGQAGFDRHLSTGEIVEQVVRARARAAETGRRLSNVVFMGMGEPFANYDRTWAAVERINDDLGLGARHLTLSTVGVVPGIRRLTTESLQVNLRCRSTSPTTTSATSWCRSTGGIGWPNSRRPAPTTSRPLTGDCRSNGPSSTASTTPTDTAVSWPTTPAPYGPT